MFSMHMLIYLFLALQFHLELCAYGNQMSTDLGAMPTSLIDYLGLSRWVILFLHYVINRFFFLFLWLSKALGSLVCLVLCKCCFKYIWRPRKDPRSGGSWDEWWFNKDAASHRSGLLWLVNNKFHHWQHMLLISASAIRLSFRLLSVLLSFPLLFPHILSVSCLFVGHIHKMKIWFYHPCSIAFSCWHGLWFWKVLASQKRLENKYKAAEQASGDW